MPDFLENFPFDEFIEEAAAATDDDEGRALAENIARNLTESIRQQRNNMEAGVSSRQTMHELVKTTDLKLAPQNERNLKASFETHLVALQRRTAAVVARNLGSTKFVGIKYDSDKEPSVFGVREHADKKQANLGEHPHDKTLAVPVPKGYEDIAEDAARLLKVSGKERAARLREMLIAKAQLEPRRIKVKVVEKRGSEVLVQDVQGRKALISKADLKDGRIDEAEFLKAVD